MPQRTQFGHHSHQTRILALNSYLLLHTDFLPTIREDLIEFVMDGGPSGKTESRAKGEAGE